MICIMSALLTSCAAIPVSGYLTASDDTEAAVTVVTEETQTDSVETDTNSTDSNNTQMESVQKEAETEPSSAMYAAYAQIIEDYEQEYGEGAYADNGYYGYRLTGVFLAQLLDFDGDGQEELLLAVNNENTSYRREVFAVVWAYLDGEATLVYSPEIQTEEGYWNDWRESGYIYTNLIYTNSNGLFVGYASYDGEIYMIQGQAEGSCYYYFAFENGAFQRARTVSGPTNDDDAYRIDWDAVSAAEWAEQQDLWELGTRTYDFESASLGNAVKTLNTVEDTKAVLNAGK